MYLSYPSRALLGLLFPALLFVDRASWADAVPVTVTPNVAKAGAAIPPEFSGLSFESAQELPRPDGSYLFSPQNRPLVTLFRTLGIGNIRFGGNTSDRATVKIPGNADIDSVFAFAKAAGAKVIYTVRLKQGDAQDDARIAKYIADHYLADLSCFAIGNEPNAFSHTYTYQQYSADWKKIEAAIVDQVPNAMFCGPSTTPGKPDWVREFVAEYGPAGHIAFATYHSYPGGAGNKVPDPVTGRAKLLSANMLSTYQHLANNFVPQVVAQKLQYRLEEANNYFNGGAKDVSDSYASALWGVDYLHWWSEHNAAGINFHTVQTAPYSAYTPEPGGFAIRPLAYGIKAFDLGAHGRMVPVNISNANNVDLTAYAVLGDDRTLYVTLVNKEPAPGTPDAAGPAATGTSASPAPAAAPLQGSHDAQVTIAAGADYASAATISLTAPNGDLSVKTGLTLGGAPINGDGTWNGTWSAKMPGADGKFTVTVPAASAMIVKLSPE